MAKRLTTAAIDHFPNLRTLPNRALRATGRTDAISALLDACEKPSQIARVMRRFGVTAGEIAEHAERASTFGTFRMWASNRLRGICRRVERAEKRREAWTLSRVAYPGSTANGNAKRQ